MTLHIHYNHQCNACEAYYIPYAADVMCPRCGAKSDEVFKTFIEQAAQSALYNQSASVAFGRDESYVPGAWLVASLGDHILKVLFQLLEQHRLTQPPRPFDEVTLETVDKMEWGDQAYMREHIYNIAVRVFEEIERQRNASDDTAD